MSIIEPLEENSKPSPSSALHDEPPPSSSPAVDAFRRRWFPDVPTRKWNDWRWQLRSRLWDAPSLERIFNLSVAERDGLARLRGLPMAVTPFYAALLDPDDPDDALRRTLFPVSDESVAGPGEADDPLGEDASSPVEGLVHRYPDRVLFLVSDHCAVYCRYCTRARVVGSGEMSPDVKRWESAFAYLAEHREVRDVLLSGGDPLTLSDAKLDYLLGRLKALDIEFVRIGTKVPACLPQRITPELLAVLKKHSPVWLSLHFTHPAELVPEVAAACNALADNGIPLGSQTVLLAGVNDDVETQRRLNHGLLRMRVRPYYLYQCDPITGSAHFRTSVDKGLEVISGLRGHTTGYSVPQYVIDAPGGGGKIPILPQSVVGRDGEEVLLRNYAGRIFRYYDPLSPRVPNEVLQS